MTTQLNTKNGTNEEEEEVLGDMGDVPVLYLYNSIYHRHFIKKYKYPLLTIIIVIIVTICACVCPFFSLSGSWFGRWSFLLLRVCLWLLWDDYWR